MSTEHQLATAKAATTANASDVEPRTSYIGVDVGETRLVTAAPASGPIGEAITLQGSHVRERWEHLVEATRALRAMDFDTDAAESQLVAAFWHQIRPQLFDAATTVVRYAQEYPLPVLVLEDLPQAERPLWAHRFGEDLGTWLMPALQAAITEKAIEAGLPVAHVDPDRTSQECHRCGQVGELGERFLYCRTPECDVDEVCRDRSAAVSIATRGSSAQNG